MDHETRRLDEPEPTGGCSKCGGRRIWGDIAPIGNPRIVVTRTFPGQGRFGLNKTARADCLALVCIKCGYTELYTRQPQDLLGES